MSNKNIQFSFDRWEEQKTPLSFIVVIAALSVSTIFLTSGIADACVVDYVCSIGMIGEGTDFEDLVVVDTLNFADEQYGIAFRKGSDVDDKVNAAITELVNDGTLQKIAAKYKLEEQVIAK